MNTTTNQSPPCAAIVAWFRQLLTGTQRPALPDFLQKQLEECSICQARLFLWGDILSTDATPTFSCERCEDDLGAYLEAEQSNPTTALKRYSELWRHLWTCPSCFDLYDLMTITLADPALQMPVGFTPPTLAPARLTDSFVFTLRLKRATINAAIPQPWRAGVAYRANYGQDLVGTFAVIGPTRTPDGQSHYAVEAEVNADMVSLIVHLDPLLSGFVILTGTTQPLLSAPLIAGKAEIRLLTDDLFTGSGEALTLFLIRNPESAPQ